MNLSLAANHADTQTFDNQFLSFKIHFNGRELGVFGKQPDLAPFTLEAFYGYFIVYSGDHYLTVAGFARGMDGKQIAIEYADILHTHTLHTQ